MRGWCDRPGCGTVASVTFSFDGARRVVWLDDLATGPANAAGHLCVRHADALRPPRGWTTHERRRRPAPEPAPSARGSGVDPEPAPAPERAAPALDLTSAPPAGVEVEPDPGWTPAGRPGDDLDEVLDARTPLLARAFRAARYSDSDPDASSPSR